MLGKLSKIEIKMYYTAHICMSCVSACLTVCLCVSLCVCVCVCVSVCLSVYPAIIFQYVYIDGMMLQLDHISR